jgi:uncharacterized lipoprotein YajG
MKTQILVILLIASMMLLGCTQTSDQINTNVNTQPITDTNVTSETQLVDQEITSDWINESETIDTGSVI